MPENKNIEKLYELKDFFSVNQNACNSIIDALKLFFSGKIKNQLDSIKEQGVASSDLFSLLICFPFFSVSSVQGWFSSGFARFSDSGKDAFYRFLNNSNIKWRYLLYLFAKRFRNLVADSDNESNSPSCLIIDDSDVEKRGKFIEGVSKIFDHVRHQYIFGFKALSLGFWDGKSFIPLDFSLHRENKNNKRFPYGLKKKDYKNQFFKSRPSYSHLFKRKQALDQNKSSGAIEMVRRAIKNGFRADYLLCDSWFFSYELLCCLKRFKKHCIDLIAMAKMNHTKYTVQGEKLSAKQLKQRLSSKAKRSRSLKARYVKADAYLKNIPVRLFIVRYAGQKHWQLMVTTNQKLNFNEMMEIYAIRWSIEVFFKEAKQYLGLGNCQSRDFDAQIASTTMVMIQYILLTYCKRRSAYETLGALFNDQKETLVALTLSQRIWLFIKELLTSICELFAINPAELMKRLFNHDKGEHFMKLLESWQYELCGNNLQNNPELESA